MFRALILLTAICTFPVAAFSQTAAQPYAGQQSREIKALSAEEIAAMLKGEGMGLAKAAELNGYPGPAHILALATDLKLTGAQRQQIQVIFDRMHAGAVALGTEIIERERALDRQFAEGGIATDRLAEDTGKIAVLQGRLRAVHLTAHLETRPLLNQDQIAAYRRLRGYDGGGATHRHHHG
jgi:hypothetical protein